MKTLVMLPHKSSHGEVISRGTLGGASSDGLCSGTTSK